MWAKARKHIAIPLTAVALGLFAAVAASTYAARDDDAFRLADLAGSRDAIGDIAIGGELRDGYMRTAFRLEQGRLTTSTELFEQPQYVDIYRYNPGSGLRVGDRQYSVQGTGVFDIIAFKRQKMNLYGFDSQAQVSPPISYGKRDASSITLANPLEYGLAEAGGNVFFAVPTAADATGRNGIYELNFFDLYLGLTGHADEHPSRQIAEIDLAANESPEPPNLEVLGLEGVGDKLALLTVESGKLIVRSYDSASGAVLGEASVPDFYLPAQPAENRPAAAIAYNESYEAFSDPERQMLSVGFHGSDGRELLLSFDFSDGVRVANSVLADFSADGDPSVEQISFFRYRNEKLYVLKSLRDPRPNEADPSQDNRLPRHLYLYVFERSKLAYKGELVTDWNDDTGLYGEPDRRYFTNLSIEEPAPADKEDRRS